MTPMMTSLKRVQDQYFTLVERVEEPVVDATERVADSPETLEFEAELDRHRREHHHADRPAQRRQDPRLLPQVIRR